METIETVIQRSKLDDIRNALAAFGTLGLTIREVTGFGGQREPNEIYLGREHAIDFLPEVKLTLLAIDKTPTPLNRNHKRAVRMGRNAEGFLVMPIDDAVRLRIGERTASAL